MTLEQMQYALEIYRSNSISKAANRLFLSQSSLSAMLGKMENELGFPLFLRSNKGITVTEPGRRFLRYASLVCANYEDALASIRRSDFRRVRIAGIHYPPCQTAFVRLCSEYGGSEKLQFSYTYPSRQVALENLSVAFLEIVLQMLPPESVPALKRSAKSLGLSIYLQKHIPIVLRIGPKHPLYCQEEIDLTDLKRYTFVDYPQNPFSGDPQVSAVIDADPDRVINVGSSTLRTDLVANSEVLSVGSKLPDEVNRRHRFRSVPLGDLAYELVVLVQAERNLPEEAQRYLRFLSEELDGL